LLERSDAISIVLNILRNSIRRDIILALSQGKVSFSEAMVRCGLDPNFDAGLFCYHLSELLNSQVVSKTDRVYGLTRFGKKLSGIIETLERECAFLIKEEIKLGERRVDEKEDLLEEAEQLYKNKKYMEAIEVYQEIYEKYPCWNYAEHALMMIGISYHWMGQNERAIEALEKAIKEHPDLRGFSEVTYFYLGELYLKKGSKDKALEAFKKSLELGEPVRSPDSFPCREARDMIESLEHG